MRVQLYMFNRMRCYSLFVLPPTLCTATVLRGSHILTDLILRDCGIDSTAMSHLCEGLSTLSTLVVLNLGGNSLGTEGTRHLGKGRLGCVYSSFWKLRCKKLGYYMIVYNSKELNVLKSLRIKYNDLRVCCSSRKIRFLSIDA